MTWERKNVPAFDFDKSLVAMFEEVVTRFPSARALESDEWQPSYRQLNEAANRLAHRIVACGSVTGDRVAILMSYGAPLVGAALGVLKASQIVVPLNPDDPVFRLRILVETTQPLVIVTDLQNKALASELAPAGCTILDFNSAIANGPIERPSLEIRPEHTAFLIFTSGTTGRPKGVMRSHRQILRDAAVHSEAMQFTNEDRIPLFSMLSTGQGSIGIWWALLNGAALCLFPVKTRGVIGLADWIVDRKLTVYISSASIFRTLIKTIDEQLVFTKVRSVRLASEAVTDDDFRALRKHFSSTSTFVHMLTSTETSVIAWSRWTLHESISDRALPVGHISNDIEVTLVGDDGEPVAPGEIGEIVVKSRYLANGYWREPELTADRFSDDLDGEGTRLVRTGDRGRINTEGLLEFCGRADDRVKIRGYRIELREVERAFEKLPGIDRVAVVAVRRGKGDQILVAYVVKKLDASWTYLRLRHAVRTNLPLYMVPSRIFFLHKLPYNTGNKVDREALRQYSIPVRDDSEGEKPRSDTERLLADIWAEIFELPDVCRDDDFFILGGDSLKGAIVAAEVHASLGVELNLAAIAYHSTLATLAAFIDSCPRPAAAVEPVVKVTDEAVIPLSYFQGDDWIQRRSEYTTLRSYRITGPLDVEILKDCLQYLIDRHEILRTTFDLVDGRPRQIIHSVGSLGFSFIDLTNRDDSMEQVDAIFREAASRPIDVGKLPIVHYLIVRVGDAHHRLARISHLLVGDGVANQILSAELAALYEAKLLGLAPPLPKQASLQYSDYTIWQRGVMRPDSPRFIEVMNWWKHLFLTVPALSGSFPFKRLLPRSGLDPHEGVLQWKLDDHVEKRLDELACDASATYFVVRLAAFAALVADVTGSSSVVIWTHFDSRNQVETQGIVGRFLNSVPFVLSYDGNHTFLEWLAIVRNRVFETKSRSEFPYHKICEELQALGVTPPAVEITFMLSSDHTEQCFGNLTITGEFWNVGTMPSGCMVYLDERMRGNCRLNFDARQYHRDGMRMMLDRYLRLLEAVARMPELPVGKLLEMSGTNPLRWTLANRLMTFYKSAPLLKRALRRVRQWKGTGSAVSQ